MRVDPKLDVCEVYNGVLLLTVWSVSTSSIEARKPKDFTTEDSSNVTLYWGPRKLFSFDIDAALRQCKIVPNVIDKAPNELLEVLYNEESVTDFGTYLRPDEMMLEPELVKWPHKKMQKYTLIAADIDVPTRTDNNEHAFLLWLIVNARESSWTPDEIIVPYVGPEPAFESGVHRVVFLVFKQPDKVYFQEPRLTDDRTDIRRSAFSIRKFAKKYKLGEPIAVNFFFCENWDYPMTDDEEDESFSIPPIY